MVRRILFALLALGPITIVIDRTTDVDDLVIFVLAALALIPLAWLIGEATEHAAHHTGAGIGGFLNATFGNAPELIIALIALNEGLTEVVRGSLTGSVVGNLLLVLGFSLAFGGRGELDRESSFMSLALVAVATVLFLIPSIPGWDGDPDRHSLAVLSVPVSIVLLLVYVGVTFVSLRRHRELHTSDEPAEMQAWSFKHSLLVLARRDGRDGLRGRVARAHARVVRGLGGALGVLRRRGHRRDRRERRGARRRGRGRLPREAEARRRDRARLERPGRGVPHPRRGAPLVADRAAGALVPAWSKSPCSRAPSSSPRRSSGSGRSSRARGIALVVAYVAAATAFFIAGDR